MLLCAGRDILNEPCTPLELRHVDVCLPKPKRAQRQHEYRCPFQSMPCPTGQNATQRHISCSTAKTQRLARRTLPNFPDKSIVIKMEQCGSGDYAGENTLNDVDSEMRIEIRKRAIGENEADIESDQRAAPSKHKAHESADVAVFLDAVAIIDPHEREVLHVVENFEQRNADQNVRDQIIAVPPKRYAGDQQSYFHGVRPVTYKPHPAKMENKEDRNGDRREKNQLLTMVHHGCRDKRPAAHVERVERIA